MLTEKLYSAAPPQPGAIEVMTIHAAKGLEWDVVILPDNDDHGRTHRDVVGAFLQDVAAWVRVLDLPGLPPKGDVIDWVKAGGTVEQTVRADRARGKTLGAEL